METKDFKKKFMKASPDIDRSLTFNRIVRRDIKRLGETMCNIIAMEELSELQKEVSKKIRNKKEDNYDLLQEIADVLICIGCLTQEYNISSDDVNKALNVKLERIEEKNKEYFSKFEEI